MPLTLDLSKNATRKSLLDQLTAAMTEDQKAAYNELMDQVVVPDHHHHNIAEVTETIEALAVSDAIKESMKGVYGILAQAEATAHNCEVHQTHFHEVGNGSAIANALAICAAFDAVGADRIVSTPVQTGCGKVQCAHGEMDIPAPATAAIIATGITVCEDCLPGELCTPTSAALIRYFVDEYTA